MDGGFGVEGQGKVQENTFPSAILGKRAALLGSRRSHSLRMRVLRFDGGLAARGGTWLRHLGALQRLDTRMRAVTQTQTLRLERSGHFPLTHSSSLGMIESMNEWQQRALDALCLVRVWRMEKQTENNDIHLKKNSLGKNKILESL